MTPYMKDAIERVVATFVVGFLGVLTFELSVGGFSLDWQSVLQSAAVAGIIAAWDVLKVYLARFAGDKESASFVE